MSALVSTIILDAAIRAGAPVIKSIFRDKVGGPVGEIGETIIDAVSKKLGMSPAEIPTADKADLDIAVKQVDLEAPALLDAFLASQKEANKLMMAEIKEGNLFGWLWRPAGMWLMLLCLAWYVFGIPLLQLVLTLATGAPVTIAQAVTFSDFTAVFVTFTGLYMGGHTAKAVFKR
jgi:hypothetical protein